MRILVLAYFYPPYQAAGATRAGELVRHWRALGAEVDVLAACAADIPRFGALPSDVTWLRPFDVNALPRAILRRDVARTGYAVPGHSVGGRILLRLRDAYRQLVHFPDGQVGWIPAATRTATELMARGGYDVMFSTSPPASAHIAAARVASRSGVPWVAELRDGWTRNPNHARWPGLASVERRLERVVLSRAAALVGVTATLADRHRDLHPSVHCITNGFSPDEYPSPTAYDPDLLLHIGTVYPGYDLELLFAALRRTKRPPRVVFMGRNLGPVHAAVQRLGRPPRLELLPPVDRPEALATMTRAAANLAFVFRSPDGRIQPEYAQQKFYEYIGAGRPVIVVGPTVGDGPDLLNRSGLARFADDPDALARTIDERDAPVRRSAAMDEYAYPQLAQRYLELFSSVAKTGAR